MIACFCGELYDRGECPRCGEDDHPSRVQGETAEEFADRMAAFMKMPVEINRLPEVPRDLW